MVLPEEGKTENVPWTERAETNTQNTKQTVSEKGGVSCGSRCYTNEPHYCHILRWQAWMFPLDRESSCKKNNKEKGESYDDNKGDHVV